jgi:hypothetical protein
LKLSTQYLLLIILSFFIRKNCFADWVYITTNDIGNDFYVSSESIKSSGWNKRTAWELINYPPESSAPYKSGLVQQEYECHRYRVRTLFASTHSELFGKGIVLYRDSTPKTSWLTMPEISIAKQTRDYICKKQLSLKNISEFNIYNLGHAV